MRMSHDSRESRRDAFPRQRELEDRQHLAMQNQRLVELRTQVAITMMIMASRRVARVCWLRGRTARRRDWLMLPCVHLMHRPAAEQREQACKNGCGRPLHD
jgi:hypothetical protein